MIRVWNVSGNGEHDLSTVHEHSYCHDIDSSPVVPSIYFSSNSSHALCNTSDLFDGINIGCQDYRDLIGCDAHGWIVGPRGRLLFWVPGYFHGKLHTPRNRLVIPKGLELDLSQMVHGNKWGKCYLE
ncbi:hypothetical protein ID866_9647 [Astraeus odoratus]|nr:hypothetical protein ID866_9647 [Astraeus odoratus]